ncbi:MAG TPA: bifunctional oligoribonuclease/PAP phosphatase NrnA [Spirochaetia bacterium]|nr:bifunctional oligoribonuclease/PAP phosphatase NrnA [Spirochaetia bacterium]
MRPVPPELLDFIDRHQTFYVIGHKEPDGDCVGSQLALGSFLKRSGKGVALCSAGPFTRTEILPYESRFSPVVPDEKASERAAAIVLDCSSLGRIGDVAQTLPPVQIAFIDHHAAGEAKGEVVFIDDRAPAVTLMVLALIEAMGGKPTKDEAEYLLFGLCTDTGFFRHLDESSSETFLAASKLVAAGASPKRAFHLMNGGKSLFSRKLMGETLTRAEPRYDGALLVSYVTLEDQQRYGLASRDSDMLYQLLLSVAGCEAAMIIRQESETECTVGLRARERVDVGAIAASFGGGGHRLAAGLLLRGGLEEVREKLVAAFEPYLGGDS